MMVLWGTTPYDGYMGSPLYDEITTLSRHTRKRQIARHGDEEMRVGCQAPVGTTPTESFVRSYQFKMPHASVKKTEVPNPCKRLMKSMNIKMMDQTKTRKGAYDDH